MKRRIPALLSLVSFLLFFPVPARAQTQTGNASYNSAKPGLTISHSSLSFNTRVKVTNLGNGMYEEAVVNARIPISPERIADVSRDLGDALKMPKNGLTLVELEVLPSRPPAEAPVPVPNPVPAPPPAPAPAPPPAPAPVPVAVPVSASRPVPAPAPAEKEEVVPVPVPPPVRTEIQYVPAPSPSPCAEKLCCLPLFIPVCILLALIIILIVIVILLVSRKPVFWPWYKPLRIRRRYRCGRWGRNFY
jgi:hypothetical protein